MGWRNNQTEKKEVQVLESSGCRMAKHNLQSGYTGKSTSMTHGKITVTSPCVQAAQNRIGQDDLGVEQDLQQDLLCANGVFVSGNEKDGLRLRGPKNRVSEGGICVGVAALA